MGKYKVEVIRIGYACREFEFEAENVELAAEHALDIAGDHEFSESTADYEIGFVENLETGEVSG